MIFPKDFIEDVKKNINLIDIVDPTRKYKSGGQGQHIIMPCPFHDDSHPSLAVYSDHFHCFTAGCGESGDAIKWVRETLNLSFNEAIEYLAKQCGMDIPKDTCEQKKSYEQEALDDAHSLFKSNFSKITQYLTERKISIDTALTFGAGYATYEGCYSLSKKFGNQTLINSGLMKKSQSNTNCLSNIFRNRIIFPIYKVRGSSQKVAGFCARQLDNSSSIKYINSPESNDFKKSHLLFGLEVALRHIREKNSVIIVEGFFDVLSLHEHGVKNVVGSMGTALTEHHFRQLKTYAKEIILCFDGDLAGKKAAKMTAAKILSWMEDGDNISFLNLPSELDPDDCIKKYGVASWQFMMERRMPLSSYVMKSFQGLYGTPEEVSIAYKKAIKTTEMITNAPAFKHALARHLSYLIGTNVQ